MNKKEWNKPTLQVINIEEITQNSTTSVNPDGGEGS